MADKFSQGSYHSARSLGDIEAEYRLLLGGDLSDRALSAGTDKSKYDNLVWTRVLTMMHFSVSGCRANRIIDDLQEAHEEIEAAAAASS